MGNFSVGVCGTWNFLGFFSMILSDAIDFSRLLGSPMKKTSFGEQNRLAALQTKGLVVGHFCR